jgi:hypothetical protein
MRYHRITSGTSAASRLEKKMQSLQGPIEPLGESMRRRSAAQKRNGHVNGAVKATPVIQTLRKIPVAEAVKTEPAQLPKPIAPPAEKKPKIVWTQPLHDDEFVRSGGYLENLR